MYNRRFGVTVRLSVFRVPARVLIGRDSDCRLGRVHLCGAASVVPTKDARHQTCRSGDDALRVTVSSVRDKRRRRRRRIGRIASMPRGADGDTRDGATDAGRGRVGRNAVRSARAGRAYSAASWYFLILAILAWCPRGARPPTRDRRPPASSVHGRSFELPQAGHTAPQCADRASARIVYRFAADPPRAAAVAEDRGSGIFRLGVGHCARLLPRVHAFPENYGVNVGRRCYGDAGRRTTPVDTYRVYRVPTPATGYRPAGAFALTRIPLKITWPMSTCNSWYLLVNEQKERACRRHSRALSLVNAIQCAMSLRFLTVSWFGSPLRICP